jgi:alkaline phosphatase D
MTRNPTARRFALAGLLALAAPAAAQPSPASAPGAAPAPPALIRTIAFGSCARQDKPQPIWEAILDQKPDLFIFLGDNIYGDSEDLAVLRGKYDLLAAQPGFAALRAAVPIMATWDDHDYGKNDAGAEFPRRAESQQLFCDFFGVPADAPRRRRAGVYDAAVFGPPQQSVQVILLDTRYHRSPLKRRSDKPQPGDGRPGPYAPNTDADATVLGEAQWQWLEEQLRVPARLRIIASSIQLLASEHRFECWGNFPAEQRRLIATLKAARAEGVIILSGDRHSAEISVLGPDAGVGYPLYDVTSSALNQSRRGFTNELNPYRRGCVYNEPNFGVLRIDWAAAEPAVAIQIHDEKGRVVLRADEKLDALRLPDDRAAE